MEIYDTNGPWGRRQSLTIIETGNYQRRYLIRYLVRALLTTANWAMGQENSSNKRVFCTIHPVCCARCSGQMPVTKDSGRKWEGCITFAVFGCHGGKGVSRSIVNFWGLFTLGDCQASLHRVIATSFGAFACSIFEVWFTWLLYVWLLKAQVD
jgi:hypothetical protein